MIVFPSNQEIQLFVLKAQNKIADLSSLYVNRGGYLPDGLSLLLLELSDFIECLDDQFNTFDEDQIIEWIHAYNHRANLNELTYLPLTGIEVTVVNNPYGLTLPITTGNISDYIDATNILIRATPHNNLSGIQPIPGYPGYNPNERYHISKVMYDYLYNLINPFTAPTVGLTGTTNPLIGPFGFYELGTSIASINLQGSILLSSGSAINYYRYKKGGVLISGSQVNNPNPSNPIIANPYNTPVTTDTTFSFEADFANGGTKSASLQVLFKQPFFYGVKERSLAQFTSPFQFTKVVRDRGTLQLSFTLPAGNTALSSPNQKVPLVIFPRSWGRPISAISQTFEFINNWTFIDGTMIAANGIDTFLTTFGSYNIALEGNVTFTFTF